MSRYIGNGPAEVNLALSALYKAQHDILVYCAYNQDYAIKVAGEMGSQIGIDSGIFQLIMLTSGLLIKKKSRSFGMRLLSITFLNFAIMTIHNSEVILLSRPT